MSEQPKLHWYCFSYMGNKKDGKLNQTVCGSAYSGYETKAVTVSRIQENKAFAGMADSAVLIACSYLGQMTKQEFSE